MVFGAHIIIYTKDAEADRAFFREVLGFSSVDAGHGWLIFALPPAEIACHPADENGKHEFYLMCDDVNAQIAELAQKGVSCTEVRDQGYGLCTEITLPGGGQVGLYQPKHAMAISGRRR